MWLLWLMVILGAAGVAAAFLFSRAPQLNRVLAMHEAMERDIRSREGTRTGNVRMLRPEQPEDDSDDEMPLRPGPYVMRAGRHERQAR